MEIGKNWDHSGCGQEVPNVCTCGQLVTTSPDIPPPPPSTRILDDRVLFDCVTLGGHFYPDGSSSLLDSLHKKCKPPQKFNAVQKSRFFFLPGQRAARGGSCRRDPRHRQLPPADGPQDWPHYRLHPRHFDELVAGHADSDGLGSPDYGHRLEASHDDRHRCRRPCNCNHCSPGIEI